MQIRVTKARNEVAIGLNATFRACLHRGEGTQFLLGNPTHSFNLLFYLDKIYMIGGVTCQGKLSNLLGRVILSAGVTICCVSRRGNPPSRGCICVIFASAPTTMRNFTQGCWGCKIVRKCRLFSDHG